VPSGTGRRGPRYGRAALAAVGLLVSFGLWLVPRVVSGASWHTLVTTAASDASGRAWGNNVTGELDDGTTVNRSVPVAMVGIEGASSVAVGDVHGLAITPGGGVVAWGHNRSGQLGDGTTTDQHTPVPVAALGGVRAVAAGNAFSVALRSDGAVFAWGNNQSGEAGNGSAPTDQLIAVQVSGFGPGSGVVSIAAGGSHALALKTDGTVLAWGNNGSGELGDGTTADRSAPVPVTGLGPGSGVVDIAAGETFSLALKSDGTVLAWGNNASGELGDGSAPADQHTPVQVSGLGPGSGILEVVGGGAHSVALNSDGGVLAWGNNQAGELGDGTAPTDHDGPVHVALPAGARAVDIAAGLEHSLGLLSDGTVLAWGDNALGQLGDGTTTRHPTPVAVSGLGVGSGVVLVLAAGDHSHALFANANTVLPGAQAPKSARGVAGAKAAQPMSGTPSFTG
jgi:alpha-tubulin suppressor-like RCC1 family protein